MVIVLVSLAAIALVFAAAILAAAESALAVLSRGDILDEAAEHPRAKATLSRISLNITGHRESAGFARIGAETLATVLIAVMFARLLPQAWLAVLLAAAVMLAIHIAFSGSLPRSLGRTHPRQTVRMLAGATRACRLMVGPFSDLLGALGDIVVPHQPGRHSTVSSEEQLLSMVDAAADEDVLDEVDRTLIHSVFDFSDTLVREVMVARTDMTTIDADENVAQALRRMLEFGFSRAPIIGRDSDDIRGIAYQKDLARLVLADPTTPLLAEQVARPAVFVPESLAADELLRRMQHDSTHFAVVIDEYGGVAGLVTLEDLIEELVGEISDEFDRAEDEFEWQGDGSLLVSSSMNNADLGELLHRDLEYEDVDSVGGLLTMALGRIPQLGDSAEIDGLHLDAVRAGRRRRITRIRVRPLHPTHHDHQETA